MSSINPYFTFEYSQPTDYRFSHDSVFLARAVFERLRDESLKGSHFSPMRGLDLCAGCGIIGLDLLFHLQNEIQQPLRTMDFLEVQEIYRSHFEINVSRLGATSTQIKFISANYERLQNTEFREAFDLIVCNPPYFFKNQGKLSPSEFKNRCRFFIDSTFNDLILGIANALSVCGNAYVLLRDLPEHGWKATEAAIAILGSSFEVKAMGEIRGTPWVRIGRQSHPPHVF